MLIKWSPIFHSYARHKRERIEKALTRKQWIIADRILMAMIFAGAAIAVIVFF